MLADLADHALELDPGRVRRVGNQEVVEAALQVGLVGFQGGVLEPRPSSPDGAGALEQAFEPRSQHRIARLAGVLDVADQVGEADLMSPAGPASLRPEAIRGPEGGPVLAKERRDHGLGAPGIGDEHRVRPVVEHPQPPVPPADPHAGLVGGQGSRGAQARRDARDRGPERFGGGRQDGDERTFADRQAEQVEQQVAQARQRDALHGAQGDHEGPDAGAEGRAGLQARRCCGLEAPGAARAGAAVQRDPGHVRDDGGDLDPVVDLARALRHVRDVGPAGLAGQRPHLVVTGRIGVQQAMGAWMWLGLALGQAGPRRLLSGGRRQARVVRRLVRQAELGLQFRHPCHQGRVLRHQRLDPRQKGGDQRILVGRVSGRRHPILDSHSHASVDRKITPRVSGR